MSPAAPVPVPVKIVLIPLSVMVYDYILIVDKVKIERFFSGTSFVTLQTEAAKVSLFSASAILTVMII